MKAQSRSIWVAGVAMLATVLVFLVLLRPGKASSTDNLRVLWKANVAYASDFDGLDSPIYTLRATKDEIAVWKGNLMRYGAAPESFQAPNDALYSETTPGYLGYNWPGTSYGHSMEQVEFRFAGPFSLASPPKAMVGKPYLQERIYFDRTKAQHAKSSFGDRYNYVTVDGTLGAHQVKNLE